MLNKVAAPTTNGNGCASGTPGGGSVVRSVGTAGSPSVAFTAALRLGGQGGASVFGPGNATAQVNQAGASDPTDGAGRWGWMLNKLGDGRKRLPRKAAAGATPRRGRRKSAEPNTGRVARDVRRVAKVSSPGTFGIQRCWFRLGVGRSDWPPMD